MTGEFAGRHPTLWHGEGSARRTVQRLTRDRETLMLVDAAVAASLDTESTSIVIAVDVPLVDADAVVAIAQQIIDCRPDVIVAVGGGTVLDASKIAALVLAPGHVFDYAIRHASRSALTLLPAVRPPVDIVAVPTTLGTSSETNSVAVLRNDRGHRLLVGHALRPRHAIIDPCLLRTLTPAAVRLGALEAFLRVAGASTSARRSARHRTDATVLGTSILEAVACDIESSAGRLRLARLSAATQRSAALRGPDPYSARHWYAANEVARVLEVPKMVATAAIIAAVWRRICADDGRWGDRRSLEDFWTTVADDAALPLDPASGIEALMDRWDIPRPPRPSGSDIENIAHAIECAWGQHRPMLRALVAADFRDVLHDSCWSTPRVRRARRTSISLSKEVKDMDEQDHSMLQFHELDTMEAPSWESFYQGALGALTLIGIGAAFAT